MKTEMKTEIKTNMQPQKKTMKQLILEKWPYFAFLLCMIVVHQGYEFTADDAALVRDTLKPTIWEEFSSVVYNFTTWSSRVLVNLPIHIMLHFDYRVWLVPELFLLFVIIWGLSYIFVTNNEAINNVVLFSLLVSFPYIYVINAGWITTTMTYIWPIAIGVCACTSIRKYLDGKKFRWYEYVLYTLATIYAANQEQTSIILSLVFVGCAVVSIKNNKKSVLIFIQAACSVANFLFHAFTPGNDNRRLIETSVRFPNYGRLSLIDKLELGFSSSLYEFVFRYNSLFMLLSIVLLVLVFCKHKNRIYRFIGSVPFLSQLMFGIGFQKIVEDKFGIAIFSNRMTMTGTIDEANYFRWQTYYPIVLLFGVSICLIVAVYLAFGNSDKLIFAYALLFGGLLGRMILAFSPTVWASSFRTFTPMYFAYIALAIMMFNELDYKKLGKIKYVLAAILLCVTAKNVYTMFVTFL